MMRLLLIGMGTGDPDHLTFQAVRALNSADLLLIPAKGEEKSELAELRRGLCAAHLRNPATKIVEFAMPRRDATRAEYLEGVEDWHDAIAEAWSAALAEHPQAERAALLVWGDPSLYDSSLRVAARLAARRPLEVEAIPGLTSMQMLTAAHGIPLNGLGAAVQITTGRRLRDEGWPEGVETLVVMLDGGCAFQSLAPEGVEIWWGARLGMKDQLLDKGPLAEAGPRILKARAEARERHGWIMDLYLMRKTARRA
ncbi:precorrin-6A synthase (deacetylating) [Neomegalonema sp.]|uniref:precorrin-6A synthase (deacetylating) n=1 Tax=Neomegalonema sp. TaxID=2039713 RepID=UPI0026305B6C|nr:precorrin-6A synthase (deacetylating) [Neomegalonema sp.]MDD2868381.1 precorrin-6A synthase (deacetylating) [Neomegalonema sp.]